MNTDRALYLWGVTCGMIGGIVLTVMSYEFIWPYLRAH